MVGQGKRKDIVVLRDAVVSGKTDLELQLADETVNQMAQFQRFTTSLRANLRAQAAVDAQAAELEGCQLRNWQEEVADRLDEYVVQRCIGCYSTSW